MTNQQRKIIAKIYKTGFYHSIEVNRDYIGFKNVHNVLFTFQTRGTKIGYLTAGYVDKWTEKGLTYESEYSAIGDIEKANYKRFYIQQTDNPDFILRTANHITLT